jgi:DNA-directed RNA polymerase beta subunit
MLRVPAYDLQNVNVYNFRDFEWSESSIIENVSNMISCAEVYGLRVRSISIKNKEEKDSSEIKKTKCKILNISLTYTNEDGTEDVELSYDLPWLHQNHFYIGGNYKVCVYQLFDKPVIKRSDMIKIRTNIQSVTVEKKVGSRKKYNYEISLFGKKFAFAKLVIAYLGVTETKTRFSLNENNEYAGGPICDDMDLLVKDITSVLNDVSIDKVRLLEPYFTRKVDAKIIEDLMLLTKIDIFSKKYFHTDNIVEEFLHVMQHGTYDDSDYSNKRLRFAEQVIYVHLAKDFYNLINSVRKNRKLKFSINSKAILQNVNVSDIVQFDNSLNPLAELAMLSRTSLSGPGGFEKSNVPQSLREIHPSMLYLIDPSDTADREGCGTIQYLIPNIEIDKYGAFRSRENKVINSISESFVPFLEHDDATRLQMSSSQQRHSIMLKKFDNALVQSGVEGMYTDQTSFMFKAKRNGKVIYLDDNIICVQYDNKSCEAFHVGYRKLYISTVDFYKVYYNIGDSFNKGDIIAESNYLRNGNITLGKNCLVAIMPWYGYNYEDGIVISEKIANEDYFTSIHYVDLTIELGQNKVLMNLGNDYQNYKPLPEIGQVLRKGDIYAKIKAIDTEGFDDVIFEPVNEECIPEDCKIVDIKIFANKWNKNFPQYETFIQDMIKNQKSKKSEIIKKLTNYLTKEELEKLQDTLEINQSEKNNYKIKGDYIDGVRIEISAVYERKITVGDKLGNRHGNKGVISKIAPVSELPVLPDGRTPDIIINPLGIISRMNVGQVYEAHLSMSLMDLKTNVRKMFSENKSAQEIYKYVLDYIKIIDRTENGNYHAQMAKIFETLPVKSFVDSLDNFYVIQPPFESITWVHLNDALTYTNTPFEMDLFDPVSKKKVQNTIACGYMYFMKLNHIAQDKMSYRGIGPYSAKTSQPLGGKSRKGGQRLGEMEIWAVIGHGAERNLNEFISVKSDSIKLRNKHISEMMNNSDLLLDSDDDEVPQSLRLLQTNLKSIGLDYELFEGNNKFIQVDDDTIDENEAIQNLKNVLSSENDREELEVLDQPVSVVEPGAMLELGPSFGDKKVVYDESLVADFPVDEDIQGGAIDNETDG